MDPEAVEQLTPDQCWALVREAPYGRLAVVVEGRPDVFPVNHVVDHGSVVMRTATGTKLTGADGHDVAFEVDGYDDGTGQAWSVVVRGRAHQLRQQQDVIDSFELPLRTWAPRPAPRFVRIETEKVSGRRFDVRE